MSWVVYVFEFFPLLAAISIVCAAMKEDRIPAVLLRAARFGAGLIGLTFAFALVVWILIWAFL